MLKVKMSSIHPIDHILTLQSPSGHQVWDNLEFFVDNDIYECDYWIVFDDLKEQEHGFCPKEHTLLITSEPYNVKKYDQNFLKQFGTIITAQDELQLTNVIKTHQILGWWIAKSYDDLLRMEPIKKDSLISLIVSNKRITKEHELRYKFAFDLKDYFGDRLDLYGRGIQNFDDKWRVLSPYKYTIAIENYSSKYYVTEKFFDALLCYTFPFYYGCTNLSDYYPAASYESIDITDLDGSISVIEKILHDPHHYQKHFYSLNEARMKHLMTYQFLPLTAGIINSVDKKNKGIAEDIILQPSKFRLRDVVSKAKFLSSKLKN